MNHTKILRFNHPVSVLIPESMQSLPRLNIKGRTIIPKRRVRFEILNIHGEIVCITRELKKSNLRLEKGFYLIKEKDENGRLINSNKLILK